MFNFLSSIYKAFKRLIFIILIITILSNIFSSIHSLYTKHTVKKSLKGKTVEIYVDNAYYNNHLNNFKQATSISPSFTLPFFTVKNYLYVYSFGKIDNNIKIDNDIIEFKLFLKDGFLRKNAYLYLIKPVKEGSASGIFNNYTFKIDITKDKVILNLYT